MYRQHAPAGIERRSSNAYFSGVASSLTGRRSNANGRRAPINLGSRPLAFWPLEPSKEGLDMAKTIKKTVKTQLRRRRIRKPTPSRRRRKIGNFSDLLARYRCSRPLNCGLASPTPIGTHSIWTDRLALLSPVTGSLPQRTRRSVISLPFSVGLQIAAMTSLKHVANTDLLSVRSEEMKNATMAARAVMDLLEALERSRGQGPAKRCGRPGNCTNGWSGHCG